MSETNIQENINNALNECISNRESQEKIQNLKFIKAELQRGKFKEIQDSEAVKILVKLIKNQKETIKELKSRNLSIKEQTYLIRNIKEFLPLEINEQLNMSENDIKNWISENIDFSSLKNKSSAIGIIQKKFPFIDGNVVKKIILDN